MDLMLLTHIMNTFAIINRIHKHAFISMLIFRLLSFLLTPRKWKKKKKKMMFTLLRVSRFYVIIHTLKKKIFSSFFLLPSCLCCRVFHPIFLLIIKRDFFPRKIRLQIYHLISLTHSRNVVRWFLLSTNALRQSERENCNGWIFCLI